MPDEVTRLMAALDALMEAAFEASIGAGTGRPPLDDPPPEPAEWGAPRDLAAEAEAARDRFEMRNVNSTKI